MFKFPRAALSITSQGLVSATNFGISLALLYCSPTSDYVTFLLFINVFALLSSLQNAIFISPIGVLVPRMSNALLAHSELMTARFAILLAGLGIPFVLFSIKDPLSFWESCYSALGYLALLAILLRREVARNACLVRGDLLELLKFDTIYFLTVCISTLLLIAMGRMTFHLAVLAFALPAMLIAMSRPRWELQRSSCQDNPIHSLDTKFWKEVTQSAQWAIPGVLVTWLFSNGYWFLLKQAAGDGAVAELGATRLLFTPVGLLIQGWVIMFRPVAVNLKHEGKHAQLKREVYRQALFGCIAVFLLTTIASLVVSSATQYLPASLQTPSTARYVLIWGGYFSIQWFRSGLTVASLTTAVGFRHVFLVGLSGCVIFYSILLFGINRGEGQSNLIEVCLWGLIAAETLMSLALLKRFNSDQT